MQITLILVVKAIKLFWCPQFWRFYLLNYYTMSQKSSTLHLAR